MTIPQPDDAWGVDFARADGTGGFVRLLRVGDRCWYWAYLVGPEIGLVVVRDHDVPVPRREGVLEVRADGLWAELVCETPDEHWGISLEAFGVALDGPADALPQGDGAEIGVRVPVGLDDGRSVALELLASAPVPLLPGAGSDGPVLVRALTRAHGEPMAGSPPLSAIGWADVLRPGVRV